MSAPTTPPSSATRRGRRGLLVGVVLAAVVLAGLLWWYLGRQAPEAVDTQAAIDAAAADEEAGSTDPADGSDAEAASPGTEADVADPADEDGAGSEAGDADAGPDGSVPSEWRVVTDAVPYDLAAGTGTFVGFRIAEELTTVGATEAVGRTPAVEGTVTLDGTTLADASIVADLTALTTDIRQRDGATQRALNTTEQPTTGFALTEPADLGALPAVGEPISVDVRGELTLNGVTQPVATTLEAVLLDGLAGLLVTGSFPLTLADHDLVAPSAPIVVSVEDTATVELQLYLDPA